MYHVGMDNELYSGSDIRYSLRHLRHDTRIADAGVNYPEWVLQQYLQVPAEITPRTRALAKDIAEG